jgi:hypothetical protein
MAERTAPAVARTGESLGFTDEQLSSSHICLIYRTEDQRRWLLSRYLAAGLRQGEIVRYFTDTTPAESIRLWLQEDGIDVGDAEARGAFAVGPAAGAYCPDGTFDPQGMIDRISQRYEIAHRAGYAGTRNAGEMTWVYRGFPGSDLFLAYETLLNAVSSPYRHIGMCQYDSRVFDGATLFQVLQVHPFMAVEGQIVRNPYYRKPDDGSPAA